MFKFINKIKTKEYSKDSGFSLLELSVAVGIAAIVGTAGIVATTGFIGSAETKKDNYVENAERAIADAESSSLALGETGSTGGTNSSGEEGGEESTPVNTVLPPTSPVNITVSNLQSTTATLTWGEPTSGDPVEDYIVEVSGVEMETFDSSTLTTSLTELSVDTAYTVKVTAVNSGGEGVTSLGFTTPNLIVANGGTVTTTTVGGVVYNVHTFTSVGESTFNVVNAPDGAQVEYLIVAGGGGGGAGMDRSHYGGGGGAGGLLTGVAAITTQLYNVTVGEKGSYINSVGARGTSGGNSSALGLTSIGGGGGAGNVSALSGGSGGGASYYATTAGTGTSGQGFRGGNYSTGGQGAPGGSSSGLSPNNSTVAAPGTTSLIGGSSVVYARGGDGSPNGTGGAGFNNGNGGKGGRPVSGQNGNNGTDGIVIIRYVVGLAN